MVRVEAAGKEAVVKKVSREEAAAEEEEEEGGAGAGAGSPTMGSFRYTPRSGSRLGLSL